MRSDVRQTIGSKWYYTNTVAKEHTRKSQQKSEPSGTLNSFRKNNNRQSSWSGWQSNPAPNSVATPHRVSGRVPSASAFRTATGAPIHAECMEGPSRMCNRKGTSSHVVLARPGITPGSSGSQRTPLGGLRFHHIYGRGLDPLPPP